MKTTIAVIIGLVLTAHGAVLEFTNGDFATSLEGWTYNPFTWAWDNGEAKSVANVFDQISQTVLTGSDGDWTVSYDYRGDPGTALWVLYQPWVGATSGDWKTAQAVFYTSAGGTSQFTLDTTGTDAITVSWVIGAGPVWLDNITASFDPAYVPPSLPEPVGGLAFGLLGLAWAIRRNR